MRNLSDVAITNMFNMIEFNFIIDLSRIYDRHHYDLRLSRWRSLADARDDKGAIECRAEMIRKQIIPIFFVLMITIN